ncbi:MULTISPECIES: RNA-binding protein [Staphylococcus]|uniref:RNA-binding protein n=3 Tax=Staphylococcus TaxID=1279 RepID=A0A4Q9WTV8_STAHO|nr:MULTISPECIES: RNA-binding protein [Staphylococcus]OFM63637.1 RNA-binding protein [Staphylococcus sp. HMSC062C01]OFM79521.1 RNA-binding protein [Staphylococcus sp. HMSC074B09]OFM93761.1 RNA-binding protein [Staphylococcus sp. HMSC078D05]OFS49971.1 RNA-binding protein [Staphylococcus sp. HMSC075H09]OFU78065.1 RNA-binding protein [Staphylococcus sp. HMSC10B09]OHO57048.1 RNA-binding protein [Staphylococcus sp. HMSC035F02]
MIDIYQHFRNEEQPLIDQLLDKCEQVNQQYAPVLTSFLDPRGQYILEVIVGSFEDMKVSYFGGQSAERKRAIIAPSYFEPTEGDFEEVLIQINYPEKFVSIQHQHVLGTLMSLGIEREQVGDILVGDTIQFVLTKQLESYIMMELTKIKGATVKLDSIPFKDMIQSKENWNIHHSTVSALRLDVVLKEMIRKSRSIAKQLIEKKRVKVNHTLIDSPDFQLQNNDLLSIQGFGRARIIDIGGKTKKEKVHITYQTLFK